MWRRRSEELASFMKWVVDELSTHTPAAFTGALNLRRQEG